MSPRRDRRRRAGANRISLWQTVTGWAAAKGPVKTLLLSVAAAALLAYAAYNYVLSPMGEDNDKARAALIGLLAKNEEARQVEVTKEAFFKEYGRIQANYETAKELLPAEVEVSNVLGAVQELAVKSGVKLTRIDLSQPGVKSPSATPLYERVAPAQVVGTHKALAEFLSSVASYPRIIHVREVNIAALKQKESIDMTLAAFYAPPPGELPPVPAEIESSGGRK